MAVPAILLLENEEPFHGTAMGYEGTAAGIMAVSGLAAGFTDLLTDPVYSGKIVCFTYPHVGNAGLVPGDLQSDGVAARAVVVRELSRFAANRLGVEPLDEYFRRERVPVIEGVDTRTITEIVMRRGRVRAVVGCGKYADADALAAEFAKDQVWLLGDVGTAEPYEWKDASNAPRRWRVLVYDLGVKKGFLRRMSDMGCSVKVVPADYPAAKVLAESPDGVVVSAGPGLPNRVSVTVGAVGELLGRVPVWGVGLGAGVVAESAGATLVVNGRGHLGVQAVGRTGEPSGEMTMQCHEFWIENESLAGAGLLPTHFNLNDGSLEGFTCAERRFMGVLFHPESEPGPRDSLYLFDRFHEMMGRK